MRYYFYRSVDGDLAGSSGLVGRAVVAFIQAMLDVGAIDLDDCMDPEECFWEAREVASPTPALALAACPQATPEVTVTAMEVLRVFDKAPFMLSGARVIGNSDRGDKWAWFAVQFAGIRNTEFVAEDVNAHVSLNYVKECAANRLDEVFTQTR